MQDDAYQEDVDNWTLIMITNLFCFSVWLSVTGSFYELITYSNFKYLGM